MEMSWFKRYVNYLKTWRKHRETIKALNKLTDRELADIGLSRGQIDALIWLKEDLDARPAAQEETPVVKKPRAPRKKKTAE